MSARPGAVRASDILRSGAVGLRARPLRAGLSALGIAIGIASIVAVLSLSRSSQADLLAQLDRLGTNYLTITPGASVFGEARPLPTAAPRMLRRMRAAQAVTAVEQLDRSVLRTNFIAPAETAGIAVQATELNLVATLRGALRTGSFLNPATARYPVVVLGAVAATRLGVAVLHPGQQVWLGQRWFSVAGILKPLPLQPEIDRSALIGFPVARELFGATGSPSTIYLRADPDAVLALSDLVAPTANPENPDLVDVSRPSDVIAARAAAKTTLTSLFLGLGAVALLVGTIGIANVMVVSVLERRSEIGLRRALGATKKLIAAQFLAEALILAMIGGALGCALGAAATAAYAWNRGWTVTIPLDVLAAAAAVALASGAISGLYPAMRAARQSPSDALRTT